jgi:hypothetical protein
MICEKRTSISLSRILKVATLPFPLPPIVAAIRHGCPNADRGLIVVRAVFRASMSFLSQKSGLGVWMPTR